MAETLKDILNGVKSSKKGPLSIGKDSGVDYKPKSDDEEKFIAKHEIEDHDDRVGNKPNADAKDHYDTNMKNHGHKRGDDKKVYEAKKAEDAQCNHSAKGVACPVHGMAECYDMKTIKEIADTKRGKDALVDYISSAASNHPKSLRNVALERGSLRTMKNRSRGIERAAKILAKEEVEEVEMVMSELKALANKAMHLAMAMPKGMHVEPWVQSKIAQAKSYVSDVHDYMIYGDHKEEEEDESDTPMTFPNMNVDHAGMNV